MQKQHSNKRLGNFIVLFKGTLFSVFEDFSISPYVFKKYSSSQIVFQDKTAILKIKIKDTINFEFEFAIYESSVCRAEPRQRKVNI